MRRLITTVLILFLTPTLSHSYRVRDNPYNDYIENKKITLSYNAKFNKQKDDYYLLKSGRPDSSCKDSFILTSEESDFVYPGAKFLPVITFNEIRQEKQRKVVKVSSMHFEGSYLPDNIDTFMNNVPTCVSDKKYWLIKLSKWKHKNSVKTGVDYLILYKKSDQKYQAVDYFNITLNHYWPSDY